MKGIFYHLWFQHKDTSESWRLFLDAYHGGDPYFAAAFWETECERFQTQYGLFN